MPTPDKDRLQSLHIQRYFLLCTLALIETIIAAESATCALITLNDGLARPLDDEIWLQRVLNRRLLKFVTTPRPGDLIRLRTSPLGRVVARKLP